MCILFLHAGGTTECKYKLILASNRDEFYKRPAASAAKWQEDPDVIGGRDMEPGREGGTWLAASPIKNRVAVILNLPGAPVSPIAMGRGGVVKDYVMGNQTTKEYVQRFNQLEYGPFNLVTAEIRENSCDIYFYSNFDHKLRTFTEKILGFGNSLPEVPFKKAVAGTKRFEDIVSHHGNDIKQKDKLINEVLSLLKWDKLHLPDDELAWRNPTGSEGVAAVFVKIPQMGYGTRTHTIILVDQDDNMDFYEWTLIENQSEWLETHIQRKCGT